MRKIFTRILAVMLVCLFVISGFNFSVFASSTTDLGEKLSAMNVEVSGRVSLMFYFTNMDNVSYFKVTVPNRDGSTTTKVVEKSSLKYDSANDRYLLKVALPAAQQADKVKVQAFNANGVGSSKTRSYSVADYADILFTLAGTNSAYESAAKAVRSMLNYGAMAQQFFNYNTENLANSSLYYRGTNPVDDMAYEDLHGITNYDSSTCLSSTDDAVIKFTGANAYLEDAVSLRFYFEYNGSAVDTEDLTVVIDEVEYENQVMKDEQGNYYILVNNIPATLFNHQYQVLISEGANFAVLKYSVLNYIQARLAKSDDQNLIKTGYSMFQFYTTTSEYVGEDVITDQYITACRHERTYIVNNANKPIVCADCGTQTGNSGTFNLNGSSVTTSDGMTYTVSGGNFETDAENGLAIPYGTTMSLTGSTITSKHSANYFTLDYYASGPVKVTMNYTYGSGIAAPEVYYLEAGENIFSAFDYSFLSDPTTPYKAKYAYYAAESYAEIQKFALQSISITPLDDTLETTSFVLFNYSNDQKTVTLENYTHGGAETITEKMVYASNSRYKLGISITYGGAISALYDLTANDGTINSETSNTGETIYTNLVNNYDTGRLIQQSYYGTTGATDSYEPRYYSPDGTVAWHYNPVQGGDEDQNRARLIDLQTGTDASGNPYIYIKTQPRDWACEKSDGSHWNDGGRFTFCYMENRYTLTNDYVQVDNRLVDYSDYDHGFTGQELPAFYTLSYFDDYYWYNGSNPWVNDTVKVEDGLPFWGLAANVNRTTFNYQSCNTETWGAYVNQSTKYGIGMYVPNVDMMKGGITGSEGTSSSISSDSSYFTAMKVLKIVPYEALEYSYLLAAGNINTIRQVFTANKDFASNYSLNKNDIPQKLPNEQDMTTIDFSEEDNVLFLQSVYDSTPSYDETQKAAKLTVTGDDSYFYIKYNLYDSHTYTTTNYSCIEFEYMIPADSTMYPYGTAAGQELYYQVNGNDTASGNAWVGNPVTLIADGKYHTARIYTAGISGWTGEINSLRIDFLNDGITSGQVIYLKSFSLRSNVYESTPYDEYAAALNVGYSGSALLKQFTDGSWDSGIASAIVYDEEFVRVISGTGNDQYVGFMPGGTTTTGNYMVVKYRTNTTPSTARTQMFATAGSTNISGNNDNFLTYGLVGDGRWHTLVIDLSASGVVASGNGKLKEVRYDIFDAFPSNAVIDFAYVGFCDSISDVKLASGEYIEYGNEANVKWQSSIDNASIDGVPASKVSTNYSAGATQPFALEGCLWDIGGWVAVNGQTISNVDVCVVDEDGIEHWTAVTKDGSGANRWYEASDITSHVTSAGGGGYSSGTKGYRIYPAVNLSEYEGQTVKLSVRVITSGGYAVTVYAVTVRVVLPIWGKLDHAYAGDTLYREMFGGAHDAFTESEITNNGGTVTANGNKWIGVAPGGSIATGKYMVIRYRTRAIPSTGIFYLYASANDNVIDSDEDIMTTYGLVGDGKWHTLVIDLSASKTVTAANDGKYYVNQIRLQMLDRLAADSSTEFEYIGFCDKLSDIMVKDGECVEYGWQKWLTNLDFVYMDGATASKSNCNYEAGATQRPVLDGTVWNVIGWTAIDGQSINDISICVIDDIGREHWTTVTKVTNETTNAWWEASNITTHVTSVMNPSYSPSTVGYKFNLFVDLTQFAGQRVSVSVRATTAEGFSVIVYAAQVNVSREFAPAWNMSIDAIHYCTADDFSDITTTTAKVTNSTTQNTIFGTITAKYLLFSNLDYSASGWVGVNGYDLSAMTYSVKSGDTVLTTGNCTITVAEPGVQSALLSLGYYSSTVGYRVASPLINLGEYSGQTVTVVFSAVVKNANANTIDVLEITVNVP